MKSNQEKQKPSFGIDQFRQVNVLGIFSVINASLLSYVGDCEHIDNTCHFDPTNSDLVIDEISCFLDVSEHSHIYEYLLRDTNFKDMLTACKVLADGFLDNCEIVPLSKESADIIDLIDSGNRKLIKQMVKKGASFEHSNRIEFEIYYQALVLRELAELISVYITKFEGVLRRTKPGKVGLESDYEQSFRKNVYLALTKVGLNVRNYSSVVVNTSIVVGASNRAILEDVIVMVLKSTRVNCEGGN